MYDSNDAAIEALKNKQIDGDRGRPADGRLRHQRPARGLGQIVGTLDQGTPEHFSAVLAKGSPLTACVNAAIKALTDDGTLDER